MKFYEQKTKIRYLLRNLFHYNIKEATFLPEKNFILNYLWIVDGKDFLLEKYLCENWKTKQKKNNQNKCVTNKKKNK